MNHTPIRVDRFDRYLSQQGLSRTKPRRLLYRALATLGPQTPAQLVAALDGQVDRATVYRTVEFFLQHAIAVRLGLALELGEAFKPHHHHLVCTQCGRSVSVDDDGLEQALAGVAERFGFALDAHQVELTGLCRDCRGQDR